MAEKLAYIKAKDIDRFGEIWTNEESHKNPTL